MQRKDSTFLYPIYAHGESEGEIIGMGWLDRLDLIAWIQLILDEQPDASIILHGGFNGRFYNYDGKW